MKRPKLVKRVCVLVSLSWSLTLMAANDLSINQTNRCHAQGLFLNNTLSKVYPSHINGIKYNLYISLPKQYAFNNKSYPIIYLLDADYSFALTKQISEHLSDRKRINDSIIIGIAYANPNEYKKNRTRDYTPSHVHSGGYGPEYQKYSGGAESFYRFLSTELIPYLHQTYRINPNSTFIGHSYGGLFGTYLLLYHPGLFNHYIIVSPSLWYDNQLILKAAQRRHNFNLPQKTQACFMIGDQENKGDYQMINDLKLLNKTILNKPHRNLSIFFSMINDMDHDTIFPAALSQGLLRCR